MINLAVVIPTYQRVKKLERCIESIISCSYRPFHIFVMCDNNDIDTFKFVSKLEHHKITPITMLGRNFVIGCWNYFSSNIWDTFENYYGKFNAMAWIVDDVELYHDCLFKACLALEEKFPDTDGVVGMAQECPDHKEYTYKPFGQCIIGKKFAERYPNKQVCCPDYIHFYQDEEMWVYALKNDKFHFESSAKLKHYHPGFIKKELDHTHYIVRTKDIKNWDDRTRKIRLEKKLVWGENFELINEEKPEC